MPRLLVTLCTFNERENLAQLVAQIHEHAPQADVLVIDDASPDGTGELADELAAADSRVRVLHRAGKAGLGAATVAGFQYGIRKEYHLLLNMDADHSHPPSAVPRLLDAMADADVAIGSRYVAGGRIRGWPLSRHVMSRGVNLLSRRLLGLPVRDCSGAFRCYRVALLRQIDFAAIVAAGYAFEEEILYRCHRAGARFAEVPICFVERQAGTSKVNLREVAVALRDLATLSLENLQRRTVQRALEPSAAISPAQQSANDV